MNTDEIDTRRGSLTREDYRTLRDACEVSGRAVRSLLHIAVSALYPGVYPERNSSHLYLVTPDNHLVDVIDSFSGRESGRGNAMYRTLWAIEFAHKDRVNLNLLRILDQYGLYLGCLETALTNDKEIKEKIDELRSQGIMVEGFHITNETRAS